MNHYEKSGPWLEARITRQQEGLTVDALLAERMELPAPVRRELFRAGNVLVNKDAARPDRVLKPGDRLRCLLFPEEEYGFEPAMIPLDVLHEDDHLIVVNKPAGMKVHPNGPQETDTLLNALAFHYQMHGLQARVRILHRLDQETSGAILFPKHGIAQRLLDEQLAARDISREYWALAAGRISGRSGVIDAPIGRDRSHPTRRRVSRTGKPAVTEWEVIERFAGATLVKAKLRTGRTHQIRVHLAHLGHPLIGDELYFGPTGLFGRQALHARHLRFTHPITGELLELGAPLPSDFSVLLDSLR